MREIKVSTSLLTADFTEVKTAVKAIEKAGTDWFHLDVMDGCFVPNITFGPKMTADIRAVTRLPLDVHLMIDKPARYIEDFVKAGADWLTVHIEAADDPARDLGRIRALGIRAGISIKPATPVAALGQFLPAVDLVLVMSVEPGFGGQKFMPAALYKIKELAALRQEKGLGFLIEVDGGITGENAAAVIEAGADVLVSGSFVVNGKNKKAAIAALKQRA